MSNNKLYDNEFTQEKLNNLLKAFSEFESNRKNDDVNYFDVTSYPHYENVVSNVLAFFFNTDEMHNMRDLWLRSLIEVYCDKKDNCSDVLKKVYSTIEIGRETNAQSKRIDLFIRTDDSIIIIENKIEAGDENNPYDIYHKKAIEEKEKYEIKNIIEILLSIDEREDKNSDKLGYHFVNIKYSEFFSKLRNNIGTYITDANEKWVIFMKEFINNITNIQEGYNMEIDKELQQQYVDNNNNIQHFLNVILNDYNEKADFFVELFKTIKEKDTRDILKSLKTDRLSHYLISGIGGIFIQLNDNIELGAYYDRENNPEKIKFGLRSTTTENVDCSNEIEIIVTKLRPECSNIGIDKSGWKYNVIREILFGDENYCNIEYVSKLFLDIVNALKSC